MINLVEHDLQDINGGLIIAPLISIYDAVHDFSQGMAKGILKAVDLGE